MASTESRKCSGEDCDKDAGTLQCPTCLKQENPDSFFCSQECFKRNWASHKKVHKKTSKSFDPFPNFHYAGPLRAAYPLSPRRPVPASIPHPPWSEDGDPKYPRTLQIRNRHEVLDAAAQEGMRKVCRLAREVLDAAAAAAVPGVTTDHIDQVVHEECIKRNSYPSPLNYRFFPKSVCTSVNEIICHGIPDQRVLQDGDILNIDVSIFHEGYHGDLNETYYIGDRARADPDSVRLVETTRESLAQAIALVKPGTPLRAFGDTIEKVAKDGGCSVIRTYCGHGINQYFHCPPNIPHYAKNKAVGECKPGMTFTIEPMLALGKYRDITWPDNWTSSTIDGKRSAQFEHTLLVTETGCEILTARLPDSPGGPIPMPAPPVEGVAAGADAAAKA